MSARQTWKLDGELLSPEQLRNVVSPGATVFLEQGACEPMRLHRALLGLDIEIQLLAVPVAGLNDCAFSAGLPAKRLHPKVFAGAPSMSEAFKAGDVEYVPTHWSNIMSALRTRFRPEIVLLQVSPPNSEGYCNLGGSACFEQELASLARVVIAEINPNVPEVSGDTALHQSEIDYYVDGDEPLRAMGISTYGETEREIARHVVRLIPDASTLQVGTGRLPDAVLNEVLVSGKRVGFHSGIFTDAMMRVAAASPASQHGAAVVAGMLMGTDSLYRAVNRNPRLSLRNTDFTHSQSVISGIERFVAINSAIEVDLLGQVNAEFAQGRQVAGVGGQLDFFRGAGRSPGGRSIIALPSCTRTQSRIVSRLQTGVPVTSSRADFDFVVTEYGVAEMRNRTERERADDLIRIAAPQYRKQLHQSR